MIYFHLAIEFLKIGLFAIGGGLASIPFLYDIAERTAWFTGEDIINMIAIAESTPGPLGINMATYVGYTTAGAMGGIIATISMITPSIIIIILIARLLNRFMKNKWVKAAFYGLRPAVTALIAAAFLQVVEVALIHSDVSWKWTNIATVFRWEAMALFAVIYFLIWKYKKHPIVYIALASVIGIVFKL